MTFSVPAISRMTAANVTQPDRSSYIASLLCCRVPPHPADRTSLPMPSPRGNTAPMLGAGGAHDVARGVGTAFHGECRDDGGAAQVRSTSPEALSSACSGIEPLTVVPRPAPVAIARWP